MAEDRPIEDRQEATYLGSRLEFNAGFMNPILEYFVGANSYRQAEANQRRTRSDILMDYVVMDPNKALTFVHRAIVCGVIMNLLVFMTENVVRLISYPAEIHLNQSIWWWLMVNKTMQMLQIPLRLLFLFVLRRLYGRSNQEIMYCMSVLTSSRMWYWSKCLTLVNYLWYGIGFAFTSRLNLKSEEWLNAMTAYVLCIIVFRILFTFTLIYYAFPPSNHRHVQKKEE